MVVAFADIQEQMNMVNTVKRSICETIPEIQHNKANIFKTNGNKSFKTRNAVAIFFYRFIFIHQIILKKTKKPPDNELELWTKC